MDNVRLAYRVMNDIEDKFMTDKVDFPVCWLNNSEKLELINSDYHKDRYTRCMNYIHKCLEYIEMYDNAFTSAFRRYMFY